MPIPKSPPTLLKLPRNPFLLVMGYLPVSDIGNVAQAYRGSTQNANRSIVERAREYGYEGDEPGAQSFLHSQFEAIRLLSYMTNILPTDFFVRNQESIDPEATLRLIRRRFHENSQVFRDPFTRILTTLLDPGSRNSQSEACIRFVLEYGADVNATIRRRAAGPRLRIWVYDHLSMAVLNHDHKIVELLCNHGADVNFRDRLDYDSPLGWAIGIRDWKTVRVLLNYSANPFLMSRFNWGTVFQVMMPRFWKILLRLGLLTFPRINEVRRSARGERE